MHPHGRPGVSYAGVGPGPQMKAVTPGYQPGPQPFFDGASQKAISPDAHRAQQMAYSQHQRHVQAAQHQRGYPLAAGYPPQYQMGRPGPVDPNRALTDWKVNMVPQQEQQKSDLEARKKFLRETIMTITDAPIYVYLTTSHQLEYLPQLHLGKHSAHSNEFTVDEFNIKVRFPHEGVLPNLKERLHASLKIELQNSEKKKILEYNSEKIKIELLKPEKFGNDANSTTVIHPFIITVLSHTIALTDQKSCKAINGRSDGMKSNVNEFKKKERTLIVSFAYEISKVCQLSTPIICCSSSSFQIALRPYRDEVEKINDFFNFLIHLLQSAKITIMTQTSRREVPFPHAHAPMRSSSGSLKEEPMSIQSMNVTTLIDDNSFRFPDDLFPSIKKAWELILRFFQDTVSPPPQASDLLQRDLKGVFGHQFFFENILILCSSKFFGGFVVDPFKVVQQIENSMLSGMAKWRHPDGCAVVVISKIPAHLFDTPIEEGGEEDSHWNRLKKKQTLETLAPKHDTYYYFVIESPIFIPSQNQYLTKGSPQLEDLPRCSIQLYTISPSNPGHFAPAGATVNAELRAPVFDSTPQTALAFRHLEDEWKSRDIEPSSTVSDDIVWDGKSDDFSQETKIRITPKSDFHLKPNSCALVDYFFPDDEFPFPYPQNTRMIESVLEEWNQIESHISRDVEMVDAVDATEQVILATTPTTRQNPPRH